MKNEEKHSVGRLAGILIFLSLAGFAILPLLGDKILMPAEILSDDQSRFIYFNLRLPRLLLAMTAGAVLAVCGMVFQALFQNSLASPFTLGVSGGAAFGASAAVFVPLSTASYFLEILQASAAFGGAVLSLVVILAASRNYSGGSRILLVGVALNFFFSSFILLLQYLASPEQNFEITRWLMGGFSIFGYKDLWQVLLPAIPCLWILSLRCRDLNVLSFGNDFAATHGVDVRRSRRFFFIVCSLMTGAVVAVCGPISFVGMMIPHIFRSLGYGDNKPLFICSLLGGGLFLMLCDTIARVSAYPSEMPAGVITSFAGSIFFFAVLFRRKALLT